MSGASSSAKLSEASLRTSLNDVGNDREEICELMDSIQLFQVQSFVVDNERRTTRIIFGLFL